MGNYKMITQTNGLCACGVEQRIVRQRGNKVRKQCPNCLRISKWQEGSALVTDSPSKMSTTREQIKDTLDATFWNGATVADLKAMCKERGITGYSKMKRDDLVSVLGGNA